MVVENKPKLEERVIRAAEAALADHGYVSVVDVLGRVGWLPSSVEQKWRKGRIAVLQEAIQVSPAKLESDQSLPRVGTGQGPAVQRDALCAGITRGLGRSPLQY